MWLGLLRFRFGGVVVQLYRNTILAVRLPVILLGNS